MVIKLMPFAGMNNVADDDALQSGGDNPRLFVRDAVNVNITPTGKVKLRHGATLVATQSFKNIWQSPLHGDVFATLNDQLVKVDPETWEYDVLKERINSSNVSYEVINTAVFISTPDGIFIYTGGEQAQVLTIDTPAVPALSVRDGGSLHGGTYVVAMAWLRGSLESGLSESASVHIDNESDKDNFDRAFAAIQVTLPYCLDETITGIRLYVTTRNGSSLMHHGDYPTNSLSVDITSVDHLGMAAKFEYLSPMPPGRMMRYWQGRLLSVNKNMIRFSQSMAYHLTDERHDFVMMPQRITFLVPVDGGLWVGQVDHVVFLSGSQPSEMRFVKKTSRSPIPNSAISLDAEQVGGEISQGGGKTALWLAENGYVLGTSAGQVIELQAGIMKGISAKSGTSVVLDRRVQTAVI